MPERGFDDGFWSNPFTMRLPREAKTLLAYLFTNQHCNPAGLYKIAPETIAFETKIPEEDLPSLFELINEKVKWYPEDSLVWYKNFVKRQAKSPKFLVAVGRCLENIKRKDVVKEFIEYNYSIHSISIPYGNSSGSIPIPSISKAATATDLLSNTKSKGYLSSASLLSLVNKLLSDIPAGVDRLVDHEVIKQKLSELGIESGFRVQSEFKTSKGRVDLCWLDNQDQIVVAFEIDYRTPKEKSLEKLRELACQNALIILRKDKARAEFVFNGEREKLAKILRLYEENIGRCYPIIVEQITELSKVYPEGWIEEAVREAVKAQHQNLKYIEAILGRWRKEGFKAPKVKGKTGKHFDTNIGSIEVDGETYWVKQGKDGDRYYLNDTGEKVNVFFDDKTNEYARKR